MLDAHAYAMQVKLCKANTRGVTISGQRLHTPDTKNTFAPISFQSPLTDEQLGTIIVGKMVFEVMFC